jgi:hypothetical protein
VIVGIGVHPIVEQVAVVIPGVGHPVHAGQAVGDVIGIGDRRDAGGGLAQPVADRIVGVLEALGASSGPAAACGAGNRSLVLNVKGAISVLRERSRLEL